MKGDFCTFEKDGTLYRYSARYTEVGRYWYGTVLDRNYNLVAETDRTDSYQSAILLAKKWIAQH